MTRSAKRITRPLTEQEQQRVVKSRSQVAQELPELQVRDHMRKDAREENTLSGDLRRSIHASDLSLSEIASQACITPVLLDDFLTGERTLRSDIMDRLASVLGYDVAPPETSQSSPD